MKRKIYIYVVSILILLFTSTGLRAEVINGYIIPSADQFKNSAALANLLLEESIPVYQATEPFTVGTMVFNRGDYIVSIPNVDIDFSDDVAREYTGYLARKFGVSTYPFSRPFSANVYRLKKTKAAVYFGVGTSAGALWHINAAENVKFDVGVLLETQIQQGDFADFNAVIFPSGGFYSWYLGQAGNNNIKEFVRAGNGFHGTCGGSVYGVELGLLDVSLDMEAGWPAAADLRGPIVLSNEAPDHPIMYTLGGTWNPLYFTGQNFQYVGPQVTVLAKYIGPTPQLQPYDPAISRAYGYYPNTEIINRFWDRAAAVSSSYANGKVVLIGTHPEYYPETQNFSINTFFYLNSSGPHLINTQSLPNLGNIRYLQPVGPLNLNTNILSIISKIAHFKDLSADAKRQMKGLEAENEQITDAVGEFLIYFLDDQITRSSRLTVDVLKAVALYAHLSILKQALEIYRAEIPVEKYETEKNRIEFAQSLIVDFITKLNGIDSLYVPGNQVIQRMTQHRQDLEALLSLKAREGESIAYYQGVINLYNNENETLHIEKLQTEYPILNWSFGADKALESAEFALVLAWDVLRFN